MNGEFRLLRSNDYCQSLGPLLCREWLRGIRRSQQEREQ